MKISKKTLIIGISSLLVVGAGLAYYFITKDNADILGWSDSSWLYRKSIAVSNDSGMELTDEDVLLDFDSSALISAGKLQNDCDDLRFTDSNGSTYLNYWIEDGCNTTSTKVWVRVPSLPSEGKTIYMYYGNESATNAEESWGGNVYMYADTTCPTGWTRAIDLDNTFLYGSSTFGTTGGSDSHTPGDTTCTSDTISTGNAAGGTGSVTATTTSHTHANLKATLLSSNSIPPYTSAILCYNNSFLVAQGLISMFDTDTPSGYTRVSALDNSFIQASDTYGNTGGTSTHTHEVTTGYVTDTTSNTESLTAFSATGGTITTSGSYTIHTFTSSGTFTANSSGTLEVLVVGGGGGGNGSWGGGGGGGGGGVVYQSSYTVSTSPISVTVGAGGAVASNGGNSVFGSITAIGGGGGGNYASSGHAGGSGGGGGRDSASTVGGSGTTGQGYTGGRPTYASYGSAGGGGGAGQVGYNGGYDEGTLTGTYSRGGNGISSSISGTSSYYGGGGGGSWHSGSIRSSGGLGGGGYGGGYLNSGGYSGTAGTANTGGGGGGADSRSGTAGVGGSGIVIVRYLTVPVSAGTFASATHTHTTTGAIVSTESNIPPYLNMIFAQANNDIYPNENNVLITSELPPLGWNQFTNLDEKFPRASDTYGGTGGAVTHTHSVEIETGAPSATFSGGGSGTSYADSTHTHSCTTSSASSSNLPSYTTVIYAQRKVSQDVTIGAEEMVNLIPNNPSSLLTEGLTNPTGVTDTTPEFSAIFTDTNTSDTGNYYQIQVNTTSDFTGTTMWDSTQTAFGTPITNGDRSPDISYAGSTLQEGTTYYWRIKFWDNGSYANESGWSSAQFTMNINSWQQEDFIYRYPVDISNSTGSSLTSEDVLISLDTATLISAGKLQNDCDDLRAFDSDNTTALEYWVEGGCNTSTTQIWVRVPFLPDGGKTIYISYGNASATNAEETWGGNVYMYADTTCPTGWTRASDLDNTFLYGSSTFGSTGGSNSHTPGDTTCTSSSISTSSVAANSTGTSSSTSLSHTHANLKATLLSTSSTPPYTSAILCYSNSFLISQGLISMFDTATPSGYTRVSALDNTFVQASDTYGNTGGTSTHTHSVTTGYTTDATDGTQSIVTQVATGGTITTSGSYTIHTFTSSGTFTLNIANPADILVVGGGGGGGTGWTRSGGGGGQVVQQLSYSLTAQSYTVTVGAGGAGQANGQASTFGSLITANPGLTTVDGSVGGTSGAGYTGGVGVWIDNDYRSVGGGGGGAGGNGVNGTLGKGGDGGTGIASSISGTSVRYGGGGGGASYTPYPVGYGVDGGGSGVQGGNGYPGTPNTGGGGGGANYNGTGGAGGSGIVIVRYTTPSTGSFATNTHTHTSTGATVSTESNIPSYLNMVFAEANNDTYVSSNNVIITSALPPIGWEQFTELDSKFPRASDTYGGTGGSATHTHTVEISTGSPSATMYGSGTGTNFADSTHTHSCTTTSTSSSNLPSYTTVIYTQRKDSPATTVQTEEEINYPPNAPTSLNTEGLANNPKVIDTTPEFSAIFTDSNPSDTGNYYQIQVNTSSDFTGTSMWDSGKTEFATPVSNGSRSADISYAGSTLESGETYYWRIKFWDNIAYANEGSWSTTAYFIMTGIPDVATSLQTNYEVNPIQLTRIPPSFTAIYSDPNSDNASAYQIQVNTNALFTGTIMWDSGKVATSITSGARSSPYTYDGTALTNSHATLYWRIKFWDIDDTTNDWSATAQFEDTATHSYFEGLKLNGLQLN